MQISIVLLLFCFFLKKVFVSHISAAFPLCNARLSSSAVALSNCHLAGGGAWHLGLFLPPATCHLP